MVVTLTKPHTRVKTDFVPFPATIGAEATIDEEKILYGVIGYKKIGTAIIIYIGCDNAQSLSHPLGDVGPFTDFSESAIPIVVVEKTGSWIKNARNAVVAFSQFVIAATKFVYAGVIHKGANKQI